MTGTGLKKWSPPNVPSLSGQAAAMSLMANEDVLEARMVLDGATLS